MEHYCLSYVAVVVYMVMLLTNKWGGGGGKNLKKLLNHRNFLTNVYTLNIVILIIFCYLISTLIDSSNDNWNIVLDCCTVHCCTVLDLARAKIIYRGTYN